MKDADMTVIMAALNDMAFFIGANPNHHTIPHMQGELCLALGTGLTWGSQPRGPEPGLQGTGIANLQMVIPDIAICFFWSPL